MEQKKKIKISNCKTLGEQNKNSRQKWLWNSENDENVRPTTFGEHTEALISLHIRDLHGDTTVIDVKLRVNNSASITLMTNQSNHFLSQCICLASERHKER